MKALQRVDSYEKCHGKMIKSACYETKEYDEKVMKNGCVMKRSNEKVRQKMCYVKENRCFKSYKK